MWLSSVWMIKLTVVCTLAVQSARLQGDQLLWPDPARLGSWCPGQQLGLFCREEGEISPIAFEFQTCPQQWVSVKKRSWNKMGVDGTLILCSSSCRLLQVPFKHNLDFIEAINMVQSSWKAVAYPELEKYTRGELINRAGGLASRIPMWVLTHTNTHSILWFSHVIERDVFCLIDVSIFLLFSLLLLHSSSLKLHHSHNCWLRWWCVPFMIWSRPCLNLGWRVNHFFCAH